MGNSTADDAKTMVKRMGVLYLYIKDYLRYHNIPAKELKQVVKPHFYKS